MDNAPALRQSNLIPTSHEMATFEVMARSAVESKMYKGIGDLNGVMMVMLAARELGISPVMSLNGGLNIINGKTEISARMMNALIRRGGHSIKILESTDQGCKLFGTRSDNGDTAEATYTLAEAQKAGLVKAGGGWTKNPKDMCFARALSRLARQLFADVIGMGYVEGEISQANEKPQFKRGTPMPVVMEEVEVEVAEPKKPLEFQYLDLFSGEDACKAVEYKNIVMKHFKWDDDRTYMELMKDPEATKSKFNAWKEKNHGQS